MQQPSSPRSRFGGGRRQRKLSCIVRALGQQLPRRSQMGADHEPSVGQRVREQFLLKYVRSAKHHRVIDCLSKLLKLPRLQCPSPARPTASGGCSHVVVHILGLEQQQRGASRGETCYFCVGCHDNHLLFFGLCNARCMARNALAPIFNALLALMVVPLIVATAVAESYLIQDGWNGEMADLYRTSIRC